MKYLILLLAICLVGCDTLKDEVKGTTESVIPPGAVNITYIDDEWGSFELEENGKTNKYLFTRNASNWHYILIPTVETEKEKEVVAEEEKPKPKEESAMGKAIRCPQCGARVVITELGPVQILTHE